MSPQEFWRIAEARKPEETIGSGPGAMRRSTFNELVGMLHQ